MFKNYILITNNTAVFPNGKKTIKKIILGGWGGPEVAGEV